MYTTAHAARGEVYDPAKRARKPLAGAGVVGSYSSGERVSGQVYPGYGHEVNSEVNTEKRVQGPTHGQQCLIEARMCLVS